MQVVALDRPLEWQWFGRCGLPVAVRDPVAQGHTLSQASGDIGVVPGAIRAGECHTANLVGRRRGRAVEVVDAVAHRRPVRRPGRPMPGRELAGSTDLDRSDAVTTDLHS